MIQIPKSQTADTRTCDYASVSKLTLMESSAQHIRDVRAGLAYFIGILHERGKLHDYTKIDGIDEFYRDFVAGFETTGWWENHVREERHHLSHPAGVRDDVDLFDVLEYIVDGVMAGMARSGVYRKEELPPGLLEKAFENTIAKLLAEVEVVDDGTI